MLFYIYNLLSAKSWRLQNNKELARPFKQLPFYEYEDFRFLFVFLKRAIVYFLSYIYIESPPNQFSFFKSFTYFFALFAKYPGNSYRSLNNFRQNCKTNLSTIFLCALRPVKPRTVEIPNRFYHINEIAHDDKSTCTEILYLRPLDKTA